MYEYKFIRINARKAVKHIFLGKFIDKYDYHKKINDYAKVGWYLKDIFVSAIGILGVTFFVEMIFERVIVRV